MHNKKGAQTMGNKGLMKQTMIVTALAIITWLSAAVTQAADPHAKAKPLFVPTESLGVIASGAVEDSLKACLARIPKDASAGQRMVAVQTCERDDETRQTFRSPGP